MPSKPIAIYLWDRTLDVKSRFANVSRRQTQTRYGKAARRLTNRLAFPPDAARSFVYFRAGFA